MKVTRKRINTSGEKKKTQQRKKKKLMEEILKIEKKNFIKEEMKEKMK